jgi:hypothetical protein
MSLRRMLVSGLVVAFAWCSAAAWVGLRCVLVMLCCFLMRARAIESLLWTIVITTPRPYAPLSPHRAYIALRFRANRANLLPHANQTHESTLG